MPWHCRRIWIPLPLFPLTTQSSMFTTPSIPSSPTLLFVILHASTVMPDTRPHDMAWLCA